MKEQIPRLEIQCAESASPAGLSRQQETGRLQQIAANSPSQLRLTQLSAIANAPRNLPNALTGNAPVVQRATFLIGYNSNDPMYEGALSNIAAPNPIHPFKEDGTVDDSKDTKQKIESLAAKPKDPSTLHIIGHGSPGSLSGIKDLNKFLEDHKGLGISPEVKTIDLYACFAMMTTDRMEPSVAYKVAKWAQANLDEETKQTIRLRTGLTSNSSGLFAQGQPSHKWLDKEEILTALPIDNYVKAVIKERLKGDKDKWKSETRIAMVAALNHGLSTVKSVISEAIIGQHPDSNWGQNSRAPAKTFEITKLGIPNESSLKWGYFAASFDEENPANFPQRVSYLHGLDPGIVATVFANAIDAFERELRTDYPFDAEGKQDQKAAAVEAAPQFQFGVDFNWPQNGGNGVIAESTGQFTFGFGSDNSHGSANSSDK